MDASEVNGIRVRPMTATEFETFRARSIREYAAEHVRAGAWSPDDAEALAAKQTDELLPQGVATQGMLLLAAEAADGGVVGTAWVALERPEDRGAWVYQIEITPEQRGKGYGRALLAAAERETAERGATAIGLNVFGANVVARSLYESAGYEITSLHMRKALGCDHEHLG